MILSTRLWVTREIYIVRSQVPQQTTKALAYSSGQTIWCQSAIGNSAASPLLPAHELKLPYMELARSDRDSGLPSSRQRK